MEEQDLAFKTSKGEFTYKVGAIIIKDKKLLMAKHEDYPCYYTVGGKVRINETSEEAVIGEAYEETGIELQIDRLSFINKRFFEITKDYYHPGVHVDLDHLPNHKRSYTIKILFS